MPEDENQGQAPEPQPTDTPSETPAAPETPPAEATPAEAPADAAGETDEKEKKDDLKVTYEVTETGPCQKKVAVSISHEEFTRELDKQMKELQETVVTPGFRKGKAPRRILERRYAKALIEEVKRNVAARGLEKALTESNFEPVGEPTIGDIKKDEGGPLTIDATMEVRPQVALKDYQGLQVTKRAVSVGDKDVDRFILGLREQRGRLVPVADPAAVVGEHDFVVCDYVLTVGDKAVVERKDVTVPMRLKQFPEITELSPERLLGAKVGDTVETTFELTQASWPEDVRGKQGTLKVTVHEIKRLELPELTKEFIESLGAANEDSLRASVEMMLLRDQERDIQQDVEAQIERQLLEQADFTLPPSLVAAEAESAIERTRIRLMEYGIPAEDIERRSDEIAAESHKNAERTLKLHFIYQHIAEKESIDVDPRDIEDRYRMIAERYEITPRQVRLQMEKEGRTGLLRLMILEQKVTDWLLEKADLKELEPEVEIDGGPAASAPETT